MGSSGFAVSVKASIDTHRVGSCECSQLTFMELFCVAGTGLSALYLLTELSLIQFPVLSHFAKEEIEVPRCETICLRSQSVIDGATVQIQTLWCHSPHL